MHSSSDIPKVEPTELVCGTTVKWTKDLSNHYPADEGWTLTYYFRGPTRFDKAATGDGRNFAITLSATDTSDQGATPNFAAGRYTLVGRVSKSSEVFQVYSGILDVERDPNFIAAGEDLRTQAKRILDAHLEAYEAGAGRRERAYSFSAVGRSFTYHSFEELQQAIDYWRAQVAEEDNATGKGKNILIRFNCP